MKIAITGHRPSRLGNDYALTSELIINIRYQIVNILLNVPNEEKLTLITGMALGIDTLFAKIAIDNYIPFIAAIPCKGQEKMWPKKHQEIYHTILNNPLCTMKYVSTSGYTRDCMQKRNEWMVDECNQLIAVWDTTPGGTANCINYALKKQNLTIHYINPKNVDVKLF